MAKKIAVIMSLILLFCVSILMPFVNGAEVGGAGSGKHIFRTAGGTIFFTLGVETDCAVDQPSVEGCFAGFSRTTIAPGEDWVSLVVKKFSTHTQHIQDWATFGGIALSYVGASGEIVGLNGLQGGTDPNSMSISKQGDVDFDGGAGLQFGEICYHDGGFNVVLAAQDTDYQVLGFNFDGESNGSVIPDHANDHITVGEAGRYLVSYTVSARSAQANLYEFHVMYNNGVSNSLCSYTHRHTAVANQVGVASSSSIINLPANATVELWARRADGAAVSKTITIEQVNLNVMQIGGAQ